LRRPWRSLVRGGLWSVAVSGPWRSLVRRGLWSVAVSGPWRSLGRPRSLVRRGLWSVAVSGPSAVPGPWRSLVRRGPMTIDLSVTASHDTAAAGWTARGNVTGIRAMEAKPAGGVGPSRQDAETPGASDESVTPGVLLNWRERGSAGFGYASRRVGSRSLLRVARPCVTVVPGPGRIDCGQLPRSRLAIAEHSGELLSKSVRSESGVVAVEQAAQLLTPDTRIHLASGRVKLFSKPVSDAAALT
jgi:hypothetical protein